MQFRLGNPASAKMGWWHELRICQSYIYYVRDSDYKVSTQTLHAATSIAIYPKLKIKINNYVTNFLLHQRRQE